MKVRILNRAHFLPKAGFESSLSNDLTDINISLPRKKLIFEQAGKEIAKYESEHSIDFVEYDDRMICYLRDGRLKRISFEVFGSEPQLTELKRMIILRNRVAMHKSPLQKEYSTKIRESMMVNKHHNLDIKGFFNLGIIFLVLNYIRLAIESKTDHKFVFIDNVSLLVVCAQRELHRLTSGLLLAYPDSLPSTRAGISSCSVSLGLEPTRRHMGKCSYTRPYACGKSHH